MNIKLLVSMAQSCAKDSAITYDEFDKLYADLSRKEQYEVVNILYDYGIDLVDEHVENEASVLDSAEGNYLETFFENDTSPDAISNDTFFKDLGVSDDFFNSLIENKEIRQSNAILCSLIQQGNRQAAQDLCIKNKALVDKYANAYLKKYGNGLDFEDLEQVGFIGLLKAAERFNTSAGAFSTYAVYWIKQAISREIIDNGFMIRIPVHMMERIVKVTEVESRCPEGYPLIERIRFIAENTGLSDKQVTECIVLRNNILIHTSLATLVGDDEESELGDFLPTEEGSDPVAAIAMDGSLRGELEKVLSTLSEREQQVLKMRFGWDDGKRMKLEQVGHVFNVTRERIRQIEAKALRKLRHPSRIKIIKDYLED